MLRKVSKMFAIRGLFGKLVASYMWLIIIPVASIGWISFKASEQILMNKISESNRQTMNQIEWNIKTLLDQVTAIVNMNNLNQNLEPYLTSVSTNPYEELSNRDKVEKSLLQVSFAFDWLQFQTFIIGKNGEIYSQSGVNVKVSQEQILELQNEPKIRANPDEMMWTSVQDSFLKDKDNMKAINAVKLLYNRFNYAEYGVFVLSVTEESLLRIYRDSIGEDATFFILDQEGRYITHSQRDLVGERADEALIKELSDSKNTPDKSTIYSDETLTSIKYLENPGWTVVMQVSVQSLFKDVRGLSQTILLMTLLLLGLSIVVAVWISRRIARPLILLNHRLQNYKLSGGGRKDNSEKRKVNELVLLTTEYEQMVFKLESTIHELVRNQEEKRVAEWNALQAQINPHFLYNTLNSIKCLVWINKTEYIEPTINALVKLLQMTIQRSEDEITLREEMTCLEHYVYIQEIRLSRKVIFRAFVDEELWNSRLPKLLLQPIVENAIFHGIERKPEDGEVAMITLYAASYLDDMRIEITDNGIGMDVAKLQEPTEDEPKRDQHQFSGIGMKNVHERLQMNYGRYYGLSVSSIVGQGTTVTLTLPKRVEE